MLANVSLVVNLSILRDDLLLDEFEEKDENWKEKYHLGILRDGLLHEGACKAPAAVACPPPLALLQQVVELSEKKWHYIGYKGKVSPWSMVTCRTSLTFFPQVEL